MTLWVKPAPGKQVLNPRTMQLLPDRGDSVDASSYWWRRIQRQEAVLMSGPPEPEPAAPEPKKEK